MTSRLLLVGILTGSDPGSKVVAKSDKKVMIDNGDLVSLEDGRIGVIIDGCYLLDSDIDLFNIFSGAYKVYQVQNLYNLWHEVETDGNTTVL